MGNRVDVKCHKRRNVLTRLQLKYNDRYVIWGIIFVLPTLFFFLLFRVLPIAYSFVVSLNEWNLVSSMNFIGFQNYIKAFSDSDFLWSLQRSFVYSIFVVIFTITISLILSVVFDQKLLFRNWYRAAYFLPTVISWVVISIIWKTIYNPSIGLISFFANIIGVKTIPILTSTDLALTGIIIMGVWQGIGFYLVIFLAALQGIDNSLYESAITDGANSIQRFMYITLPMLKPTMLFAFIMATVTSLQVFPQVYVMTRGGPAKATLVAVYYVYRKAFYIQEMGYASAMAILLFLIILIISLLYLKFFKTEQHYS